MNRIIVALAAAVCLSAPGCGGPQAVQPPPEPPSRPAPPFGSAHLTSSSVSAPRPPTGPVNVSDEIVKACRIKMSDVDTAPKFDFDESFVRQDAAGVLDQVAKCLTTGPLEGRSIELVGRTDPRGTEEYNMVLGASRAGAVGTYLQDEGVSPSSITTTSRGELDANGSDEAGWQVDRRVDVNLK
jgi:peptidoglycan-associated lipoprotein